MHRNILVRFKLSYTNISRIEIYGSEFTRIESRFSSYVSDLAKELNHDKCNSEVKTCGLGVHISLAIKEWRLRVHQNLVAT